MNRSRDLADKPEAAQWLKDFPKQAIAFDKVREYLCSGYDFSPNEDAKDGYINLKASGGKIEYRFNKGADNYRIYLNAQSMSVTVKIYKKDSGRNNGGLPVEDISIAIDIENDELTKKFEQISKAIKKLKIDGFSSYAEPQTLSEQNEDFEEQIQNSLKDSEQDRLNRLARKTSKLPKTKQVPYTVYDRDPDVVAQRLFLAKDVCQGCKKAAPFLRAKDGSPYLEVHHIMPLSKDGEDSVENTIALCPNCHRQRHFG